MYPDGVSEPTSEGQLRTLLRRLDGRSYRAYREIQGAHAIGSATLFVDRVQGDPFAAPSRLRFRVPMADASIPQQLRDTRPRRIALADFLARRCASALSLSRGRGSTGSGGSGQLHVDRGGQEVLERSAIAIDDAFVELRFEAGLPARGRRILGPEAEHLLLETVPTGARAGLEWSRSDAATAERFVQCVDSQEALRQQLADRSLVAFVGNGAVLPRESGASQRPLREEAVRFHSPPSLETRLSLPHPDPTTGAREVAGMGVPRGVTLIVGGGFHGKSTLLRAIERGVYPHVPDDGREQVVSDPCLVKVRAEDGRRVAGVDIHDFVAALPGGSDTRRFSSDDASGSTSQAAAIVEALEAGASGLLLDEDTCATNFMLRDARMQALVAREHEPITPFVDRVRGLWEERGVSSVLVMGGSGDYFEAADHVIAMRDYRAFDVGSEAREIARRLPTQRLRDDGAPSFRSNARAPVGSSLDASRGRKRFKIDVRERDLVVYGRQRLDLRGLEQLADTSQTRAIAWTIELLAGHFMDGRTPIPALLDRVDALLDEHGLDALGPPGPERGSGHHPGNLARPRRFEIAAALSRMREVEWRFDRTDQPDT